ncbi:hypothetical protein RJY89_25025 [Escherichia coli]|uniref:hypothetical protein n=1 Tax=Escherichia coli TaxID=562 RepID=UPI002879F5E4|nr:hypothetical protein [Escherichia coli]MDS4149920.1 hypothetical protein [Escherichia coli]
MKRVVMPVRCNVRNAGAGIVEISPVPGAGADNSRSSSCRHSPVSQQVVALS